MGQSLKIKRVFHTHKIRGSVMFQISCLLCGWSINTTFMNSFPVLRSASPSLHDDTEIALSEISSRNHGFCITYTGFIHSNYLTIAGNKEAL